MRHLVTALVFLSISVHAMAAVPSPMLVAARRFLINFGGGRLDAAAKDFNEEMKATVTPTVLANFKQQFDRDFGHFMSIASAQEGMAGGFPVIEMTARFEKASALFQVAFDGTGRIASLHFQPAPKNNPQLEKIARDVLDAFNARRFAEIGKHLDEKMSVQLPLSALDALYGDVTGVYGKFKSVTEVRYEMDRDFRIVKIFAEYEKAPMLFEVVFNNNARVAGWSFRPPK